MDVPTSAATDVDPFSILIASFLDDLSAAGYAPHRLAARRALVHTFARWTHDQHVALAALREDHVRAFLTRVRGPETQKHARATLHRFIAFLRGRGVLSLASPAAPLDAFMDGYIAHLRTDRGLAENSIASTACARGRSSRTAWGPGGSARWRRSTRRPSGRFLSRALPDGRWSRPAC